MVTVASVGCETAIKGKRKSCTVTSTIRCDSAKKEFSLPPLLPLSLSLYSSDGSPPAALSPPPSSSRELGAHRKRRTIYIAGPRQLCDQPLDIDHLSSLSHQAGHPGMMLRGKWWMHLL